MNTKEHEQALKEMALKLKKGDQQQQTFGERAHALALEMKKHREASQQPLNAETIKGISMGGGDDRLPPPRRFTPKRLG